MGVKNIQRCAGKAMLLIESLLILDKKTRVQNDEWFPLCSFYRALDDVKRLCSAL
jgi:hypothetical protein